MFLKTKCGIRVDSPNLIFRAIFVNCIRYCSQCAATKTASASAPGRPLSSCVVRFTPAADAASAPVPPAFAVHMSLPNARAAAVAWRVRTLVFNNSGAHWST